MRRKTLLTFCVPLLFLVTSVITAQEARSGVSITPSIAATSSSTTTYLAPGITAVYQPGTFGIGAGSTAYIGFQYGDAYISMFGRGKIGWFYLDGGVVAELSAPREVEGKVAVALSESELAVSPLISFGITPRIATVGGRPLGLDIGIAGFVSAIYIDEPEDLGEAIGFALVAPLVLVFNIPKLNVGVTYTLDM